jgi:hypothetical protein
MQHGGQCQSGKTHAHVCKKGSPVDAMAGT